MKEKKLLKLGEVIKQERIINNLSQKDLAQMAGVTVKTLFDIEKGLIDPRFSTMCKIGGVLGLTLELSAFEG